MTEWERLREVAVRIIERLQVRPPQDHAMCDEAWRREFADCLASEFDAIRREERDRLHEDRQRSIRIVWPLVHDAVVKALREAKIAILGGEE